MIKCSRLFLCVSDETKKITKSNVHEHSKRPSAPGFSCAPKKKKKKMLPCCASKDKREHSKPPSARDFYCAPHIKQKIQHYFSYKMRKNTLNTRCSLSFVCLTKEIVEEHSTILRSTLKLKHEMIYIGALDWGTPLGLGCARNILVKWKNVHICKWGRNVIHFGNLFPI